MSVLLLAGFQYGCDVLSVFVSFLVYCLHLPATFRLYYITETVLVSFWFFWFLFYLSAAFCHLARRALLRQCL